MNLITRTFWHFQQGSIEISTRQVPENAYGPSAPLAPAFLEHSADPARWRRRNHKRDIRALWGSGHCGQLPKSQCTLFSRKCAHPGPAAGNQPRMTQSRRFIWVRHGWSQARATRQQASWPGPIYSPGWAMSDSAGRQLESERPSTLV